jgi:antitoxin component YwqK of YwqJK toxin-antitoxin module
MREQVLSNGEPNGPCKVYDQRGRVIQEMGYRNGKLHGTMVMYGRDGKPAKTVEYADGKQVKELPPAMRK